jgi:hypothetical protein
MSGARIAVACATFALRVTDDDGASAETTRSIAVCPSKGGPKACKS